ncbi:putative plasmid stabilization protein (plasmid) [Hartmannibacter diazotrophicus]|uniref:Putative plasmid stabilization protein n=1 Tax=Hartmannibacter diazotrophicus TaxID=1482074 RepID=A0A2C9DDR3_9HYPH|nr:type II toxin-antitoxin system RelE/ParE family toxin [Hartmannibacter diazotrophicus]SON58437.1 putative plasmid stabilization protein [Hartmannibacter diazotrophicus]
MIVVITEEAEADLERIGDYIAADNPRRAVAFVQELADRCHRLADMPRAYPLVPRYEQKGVRRRPYGEYLIFYRIGAEAVDVLHILNSAQDYEAILFPED